MRFLSVYQSVETNQPPTPEEMERMGRLIEEGMKAGYLLGLFAQSLDAADLRGLKLIDCVLADFDHLLNNTAPQ